MKSFAKVAAASFCAALFAAALVCAPASADMGHKKMPMMHHRMHRMAMRRHHGMMGHRIGHMAMGHKMGMMGHKMGDMHKKGM